MSSPQERKKVCTFQTFRKGSIPTGIFSSKETEFVSCGMGLQDHYNIENATLSDCDINICPFYQIWKILEGYFA